MTLSGKIKTILETQVVSDRFRKRTLVLETTDNPMYPQLISIEFQQDNVDKLEGCQNGDSVTVDIDIRGREWTSPQGEVKYFNTITGWRITNEQSTDSDSGIPDLKVPEAETEDLPY